MAVSCPVCGHKADFKVRKRTSTGVAAGNFLRRDATVHVEGGVCYVHYETDE